MPTFTVDASVLVNAFIPTEDGHEESRAALLALREGPHALVEPTLALVEVTAAVARRCDDQDIAIRFADSLAQLPKVVWVPLDGELGARAAEIAAERRLRGADAVYAAVARRFGSSLVTLDREQLERLGEVADAIEPATVLGPVS